MVGGGTPYFSALEERIDLELVETRTFGSRVVYLRYRRALLDGRRDPRPAPESDQRAPHQRRAPAGDRLDSLEGERLQQRAQRAGV